MFFEFNEQQKAFREKVRKVYEKEVRPIIDEYEKKESFPIFLFRKFGEERLLCLRCPEEYGGPGLDKISECISMEELNRICAGVGAGVMVHGGLATDPILRFGSEELKQTYLPPSGSGRKDRRLCPDRAECRVRCLKPAYPRHKSGGGVSSEWLEDFHYERDHL